MDIELKLRQAIDGGKLSKLENQLALDIVGDLDLIVTNTATSLAKIYFTNTTTIYRFSQKLGFESYSQLRSTAKLLVNESLKNDYAHTVSNYLDHIDFEQIHEHAKVFSKEERYIIFGLGASNISAQAFQRQMAMLGFNVMLCDWDNIQFCITDNNLVIISSTGETSEALMLLNRVKGLPKQIISITKQGSTLVSLSDICFSHDLTISTASPLIHEQQTHIHIIITEIINELYKLYSHTF